MILHSWSHGFTMELNWSRSVKMLVAYESRGSESLSPLSYMMKSNGVTIPLALVFRPKNLWK